MLSVCFFWTFEILITTTTTSIILLLSNDVVVHGTFWSNHHHHHQHHHQQQQQQHQQQHDNNRNPLVVPSFRYYSHLLPPCWKRRSFSFLPSSSSSSSSSTSSCLSHIPKNPQTTRTRTTKRTLSSSMLLSMSTSSSKPYYELDTQSHNNTTTEITTTTTTTRTTTTTTTTTSTTRNVLLSSDPLIYTIPNFLSDTECEKIYHYVNDLEQNENKTTRFLSHSNPPEISLPITKLWPLPFLSLIAGLPSIWRLYHHVSSSSSSSMMNAQTTTSTTMTTIITTNNNIHTTTMVMPSIEQICNAAIPPILVAFLLSIGLAYGIVLPLLRIMSSTSLSSSSFRTSVSMALNQEEDYDIIQPLVNRIVEQTKHPWDHWEAPVVTKYDPGAIFSRHGDASPYQGKEWENLGGQRIVTCICYLNSLQEHNDDENNNNNKIIHPSEGGETYFDQLQLRIVPKQGKALFFFPANNTTWIADDRTTHESLPPIRYEKWIVQMFGRIQRVPSPLGLPDSYIEYCNK